jgi:hypothetical protein
MKPKPARRWLARNTWRLARDKNPSDKKHFKKCLRVVKRKEKES